MSIMTVYVVKNIIGSSWRGMFLLSVQARKMVMFERQLVSYLYWRIAL